MLNKLEKLINEHGSANILKERLGLKDDQISAIQREFSGITSKHAELERENKDLETSLDQANQEINRLTKILEAHTKTNSEFEFGQIPSDILVELFEADEKRTAENMASQFNIKVGVARYHLDSLVRSGVIGHGPKIIDEPDTYIINETGRKYIIEKGGM